MSESKHTLGPWKRCTGSHKDSCICGLVWAADGEGLVATVHVERCPHGEHDDVSCPPDETSKANARLIAASPDLLKALERIADSFETALRMGCRDVEDHPDEEMAAEVISTHPTLLAARAAIAKAKGDTP